MGKAFRKLIADWREVLPAQSLCLQVPVLLPFDQDGWPAGEGGGAQA